LNTAAIVQKATTQEKQNKFLPTDASFRILGRLLEVVSLIDSAVGSGQPTEKKTKKFGNIGLDIETDLRDFEEEKSSLRISESSGAMPPEQQQGSLARKNVIFGGYFTEKEKQYKPIISNNKDLKILQETQNFKVSRKIKLNFILNLANNNQLIFARHRKYNYR
jgi:hypothetical protein